VNATIWGIAIPGTGTTGTMAGGNPPCKHTALGGKNPRCIAALAQGVPSMAPGGPAGWGAKVGSVFTTPGGTPAALATSPGTSMAAKPKKGPSPGLEVISANAAGSIAISVLTNTMVPTARTGFTNMATSTGYPWTTGKITVSAMLATGLPERFVLSGMDGRVNG